MELKPKDRILQTATKLFLRDGYHATGIDTIVAEAGVAKMTLYKHFKSKEDLIVEVLKARDTAWMERFKTSAEKLAREPQDRLLALFDVLEEWFREDDFYGCAFINVAAEFSVHSEHNPMLSVAIRHTKALGNFVRGLAVQAGIENAEELAAQIGILLEGAIVVALIHKKPDVAQEAKAAAKKLIENCMEQAEQV